MQKRKSLVQKVFCLWNLSQINGRGHLLSTMNGTVNIWTITSSPSLLKRFREENLLYSQILTVMQLLTQIYVKRIKLIHGSLLLSNIQLIGMLKKCMEKWRTMERQNHVTITNCRSLLLHTDILNDVIQQDGRPILPYNNNNKVWLNVLWFYDILDVFGRNYKRTRTFAIVLSLRTNLQVF